MLSVDITALFVFLIVWVLVIVLTRVFWKPVRKIIDEREGRLQDARRATRHSREECEESLRNVEQSLRRTPLEAGRLRDSLAAEAGGERSRLLAEVRAEARRLGEGAKAEGGGQGG